MTRILVTGGSGFIGAPAIASLRRRTNAEIHGISRHPPEAGDPAIRWHGFDLFDRDRVRAILKDTRPAALLHLAWFVEPGVFWTSPENARWVEASLSLFRDFAASGGRRIVGAGSGAEYEWGAASLSEKTSPERPSTAYGKAKLAAWRGLEALASETGVSAAWGRVFFLYGPREHPKRLVASVIRALLRGERAPTTAGSQRRDYLHVDDVGDAMGALLESDVRGPVNIGSGSAVPVRRIVREIAVRIGREDLLDVGAIPSKSDEAEVVQASVERLVTEVGWRPRFALDSGLDHTITWWKHALGQT
jgi:nucleoside-diphosphate-sugar epimerase